MSIYKITNIENNFVYVGSTVNTLMDRLNKHEIDYGSWLNRNMRRGYISSYEILKFDGYKIELVETVDDKDLLSDRERFHINNIQCVNILLNKNMQTDTFLCTCGKTVDSRCRYKHNKSQIHRKAIREIHSRSKKLEYFKNVYKSSVRLIILPPVYGITLNIVY